MDEYFLSTHYVISTITIHFLGTLHTLLSSFPFLLSFLPFSPQVLSSYSANTIVNEKRGCPYPHGVYSVVGEKIFNDTIT